MWVFADLISRVRAQVERVGYVVTRLEQRVKRNGFFLLMLNTALQFGKNQLSLSAASVAFYALFSIFPLLLALVALFGYVVGTEDAQGRVVAFVTAQIPVSQDLVAENVNAAIQARGVIGLVSVVTLLWAATGIFGSLAASLNRAWGIPFGRPIYWQKLLELGMALAVGALLPLSVLFTALFQVVGELGRLLPGAEILQDGLPLTIFLATVPVVFDFVIFVVIMKVLPSAKVRLADIWLPALMGAILFEIGKALFGWYVANFANYRLVFGSLAAVVAFLFWAYVSALILLFSAQLAAEFSKLRTVKAVYPLPAEANAPRPEIEVGAPVVIPEDEAARPPRRRTMFLAVLSVIVGLLALVAVAVSGFRKLVR